MLGGAQKALQRRTVMRLGFQSILNRNGVAVIASKAKQFRGKSLMLLWIATAARAASR